MRKLGIDRATNYGYVTFFKLGYFILESDNFGRTDKSEVHRIKEKDDMFLAEILFERKFLNKFATVYNGNGFKFGGFFTY